MRKITLSFEVDTEFATQPVIDYLEENFNVTDNDTRTSLQFITIDTEYDVFMDIGQTGVTLRKISKPHIAIHIYNHLLWKVETWL